jgi:hypothetical protein
MPCALGLFVVARPVMALLGGYTGAELDLAEYLMRVLSICIVLNSFGLLTNAIMQAHGHANLPVINMFAAELEQQALLHTRHRTKREIECFIDRRSQNIDDYEEHIRTLTAESAPRKLYNELCDKFKLYVSERNYNKILRVYNQKSMLPNCGIVQLCGFASKDKYLKYILTILREDSQEANELRLAMREVVGVV